MFRRISFSTPVFWYFLFLMLLVGPFLPDHWSNDSNAIIEISNGTRESDIDFGGYYYTAIFFGVLGGFSYIFQAGIAYFISIFCDRTVGRGRNILLVMLYLTPAFVFGLIRPQKEVFVFLIVVFVLNGFPEKWRSEWRDTSYVFLICLVYAAFMRPYFLLIAIFF